MILVSPTIHESSSLLAFLRDFHYNHKWLQLTTTKLKHTTKRLSMLNHTSKTTLNAQSQLIETSKCLQINYLFLHLIYNQRYKQLQIEQTL